MEQQDYSSTTSGNSTGSQGVSSQTEDPVCHQVHAGALLCFGHHHLLVNSLPPLNRWTNGTDKSGTGVILKGLH